MRTTGIWALALTPLPHRMVDSPVRQRLHRQPLLPGLRRQRRIRQAVAQPGQQLNAALLRHRRQPRPQLPLQRLRQPLAPLAVQRPHAFQVAIEMPLPDKIRHAGLQQRRATAATQPAAARECFRQTDGHHQISHAQRREQRFAEGAGVQHPTLNIEAFQRRQRPPVIAKLAVVVILEDPGPALLRPVEQRHAPRQAERDAERALMGRRHHRQPRLRRRQNTGGHVHALFIHRHGDRPDAGGQQQRTRDRIAGIFDPYRVAGM